MTTRGEPEHGRRDRDRDLVFDQLFNGRERARLGFALLVTIIVDQLTRVSRS